jgi:hypothetical protein
MRARYVKHGSVVASVADPWNFGMDPDPDSRIHTSD